jgi:L-fuconolactonase
MTTPTIDAHHHFWERGRFKDGWLDQETHRPISGSFLPKDLEPLLRTSGIQKSVFVQTQHDLEENRWVLGLADRHEWIAGVVGWIDLASPRCEEQLLDFRRHSKAVGVRHITHDEPDDDFLLRPPVLAGLKVLEKHAVPFDLLFFVRHLRHASTLAGRFPGLPLVIDHLAKPRIKDRSMEDWKKDFVAAARHPNVYCKLSGMVTEAEWRSWTPADLKPYVQTALEAFGPERLMFGTDWPVCLLAARYDQVVDALRDALGPISTAERDRIWGGTAARFYSLQL